MNYIAQMWKRIFDYKGKSSRAEFWIPFGIHVVLLALDIALILLSSLLDELFNTVVCAVSVILLIYLAAAIIPFAALAVRRLHDAGKSGLWCLLALIPGIGAVILAIMLAVSAYMFSPEINVPSVVYGPPPDMYDKPETCSTTEKFRPEENTQPDVYGPPEYFESDTEYSTSSFVPEENIQPAVYDPPSDRDETAASFDPSMNTEPCVYGPPPDTTTTVWDTTTTTALPDTDDDFDPENNLPEPVYGPPEYFE